MLDIKFIRSNINLIKKSLKDRNYNLNIDELLDIDSQRREIIHKVEELKNQRNILSEQIGLLKKEEKDTDSLTSKVRQIGLKIKELDSILAKKEERYKDILLAIPNIPHKTVPIGKDNSENVVVKKWGELPVFNFKPLPHWDIGEHIGILDFNRAAKITGTRFCLYCGNGARLERALINFMLDLHQTRHGYKEVLPPFIVNQDSLVGTGQLPRFKEDLFKLEGNNYYLIPTAEVPVTNIHRDEIINEDDLPIKYVAYTPCFRSEAGSYGKDTRGIVRQHQFNKVELVKFSKPETSYNELEELLFDAETVLQLLEIPYRVVLLCTGDMGFSSAKTYDIEVWLPGQNRFCEISSCSNFEDFQARRANIRYRPKGQTKTCFVHTLNGSGLAIGRTVAAIIENYQLPDGSFMVPKVLKSYIGGIEKITGP
ncbi:MAG: serine--tRNA ligase [Dissulfurimicrobium sp.]|uniref:serine--tRNA ligase n=1 Tax=Dissulfurimicrobium TaxID=1769732 RepID=UPI001EDC7656|nr:serine--tRNA ligase [Dissulfurimicrobium hydrothermale]UKL14069.1 serine--tRNA ligase [Dissulfurimicrobium hydrothermale]